LVEQQSYLIFKPIPNLLHYLSNLSESIGILVLGNKNRDIFIVWVCWWWNIHVRKIGFSENRFFGKQVFKENGVLRKTGFKGNMVFQKMYLFLDVFLEIWNSL